MFNFPSESGWGIYTSCNLVFNPLHRNAKDGLRDLADPNRKIEFLKYFNLPITVGSSYAIDTEGKVDFLANFGLTFNVLKATDYKDGATGYQLIAYDLSPGLGLNLGGGIWLNESLLLNVQYFHLGTHKVKSTSYLFNTLFPQGNIFNL